ncbi:hypothetical protein BU25DRAFT_461178 [Macroventuria anomochaeta]|uniref:Uncharacterized protein n=1 Tax=Macroventuria anomochaeta TaxID=301207 RepID=A0ACB6RTP6_9PLEO|nr:uncharacterized protein BU25DRAFT_461178 [Macroventuria anomochaeta]KAF2624309.1 hypothetical protein BU25DRAFT_461178 [Macroventuria anomochaeta]
MAVLDARRCPYCLSVSTKGEGCSYVQCQCGAIFNWGDAERVTSINNEEEQRGPTRAESEQLQADPTKSTSLELRLDTLLNATALHKLLPGIMFDRETPMLLKENRNATASTHATFTNSSDWSDDDKGEGSETTDTIDPASVDRKAEADSRGDKEEKSDDPTPSEMCEMDRIIAERSSRRRDRIPKSIRTR